MKVFTFQQLNFTKCLSKLNFCKKDKNDKKLFFLGKKNYEMKITLKNFREYEKKEFIFSDTGSTLISGRSGLGKTSIFMAIYFVLYGILKGSGLRGHILSRDKRPCSVTLEYKNMKITRTNGKNNLTVNVGGKEIFGEEAQEFIFTEFGKHFGHTSYVPQRDKENFLEMSPKDRLGMLQTLSHSEESSKLKDRLNEVKTETKKKLSETTAIIGALSRHIPEEPVQKPEEKKCPEIGATETELQTERTHLSSLKSLQLEFEKAKSDILRRDMIMKQRSEIENRLKNLNVSNSEITSLKKQVEKSQQLKGQLSRYNIVKNARDSVLIKRKMDEYEEFQKYSKVKGQMDAISRTEGISEHTISELESEMKKKEENLRVLYKIREIKENLPSICPTTLKELNEKISNLEKIKLSSITQKCPRCNATLYVKDGKIAISNMEAGAKWKFSEQKELDLLTSLIPKVAELDSISNVENSPSETELESELKEMKGIIVAKRKLESLREELSHLQKPTGTPESIDFLRTELNKSLEKERILRFTSENEMKIAPSQFDKFNEYLQTLLLKQKERDTLTKQLSGIKIPLPKVLPRVISETEIKETEEKVYTLETSLKAERILYEEFMEYKRKLEKYEEFMKEKEEIEKLNTDAEVLNHDIALIESIQEKVRKAETESLNQTISLVNSKLEIYVEKFFQDSYVSAKILPYKDVASSGERKTEINISIEYNGIDVGINLSGGQLDRLELATILALNQAFGARSKILLLDEALSSLDAENTRNVMQCLKYFSDDGGSNFPILIIAHQAESGLFDNVLELT
jgi:DNA repair exonuclease SbcCD ATPase subunit